MPRKKLVPAIQPRREVRLTSGLQKGHIFEGEGLSLVGYTLAGISTCLTLPQFKLAFDVAQGLPYATPMEHFFISHGHLDHAAGLIYQIGQKTMMSHKTCQVYVGEPLFSKLPLLVQLWEEIEEHSYHWQAHEVQPNSHFDLGKGYFVKPFPTAHRVPSFGYTLFATKQKLKPEFESKNSMELRELARSGISLTHSQITPLFSFTGDTTIDFIKGAAAQSALESKILALDCTFIDHVRTVEQARYWGHTHLDEILENLVHFKNSIILLIHISARYTTGYIEKVLNEKVPPHERHRFHIFPRDF